MVSAIHHQSDSRAGNPGRNALGYGQIRGGQWPCERGRYSCHGNGCAAAFKKLSAGNIVLSFAHNTFPESKTKLFQQYA
jgi:hypothetical protein